MESFPFLFCVIKSGLHAKQWTGDLPISKANHAAMSNSGEKADSIPKFVDDLWCERLGRLMIDLNNVRTSSSLGPRPDGSARLGGKMLKASFGLYAPR
jgi:hypothetical protein